MQANSSLEGQAGADCPLKGGTQPTSSESGLGTRDPGEEGQLPAAWQQHLLGPRLDAAVWTSPSCGSGINNPADPVGEEEAASILTVLPSAPVVLFGIGFSAGFQSQHNLVATQSLTTQQVLKMCCSEPEP